MAHYYWSLRRLLHDEPDLRPYLVRCRHCGILFFTHPRNVRRNDLGCPFGCREAHRKESAARRSAEYYRTEAGKFKKQQLNQRRKDSDNSKKEMEICDCPLDRALLCHLHLVVSMVEDRKVDLKEIILMVERFLRQPSIDLNKKSLYRCRQAHKTPP